MAGVVAPVVAPVAPVAPCAGQGGFMTTDLRQLVLLMVQRSGYVTSLSNEKTLVGWVI